MKQNRIRIPTTRKCHGTFDLQFKDEIPGHESMMKKPMCGILSFETKETKVEIEFTEEQWRAFLDDMDTVSWKEKEHQGMC